MGDYNETVKQFLASMERGESSSVSADEIFSACDPCKEAFAAWMVSEGWIKRPETSCILCGEPVNKFSDDTWKQVVGFVGGPRKDSMRMREDTGRYAHGECVKAFMQGVPPGTPDLFSEPSADAPKTTDDKLEL